MKPALLFTTLLTGTFAVVYGQSGCASDCFSDVSMSNCNNTSNWPCLCKDDTYVDYVNTCILSSCNSTDDRLGAYYTLAEICQIFGVNLTGPEASAQAVASTSSISGLPTDIASLSAYSSALLTGPGIASFTSAASSGSEASAASTLSTMNPGGPMQPASSGSSVSTTTNPGGTMVSASSGTITSASASGTGGTVQGGAAGSTQPGGPVISATSASSASASGSTQPGGPVESTSGAASSASATASAASAANIVRPGCVVALLGLVGHAVAAL